jgi:hypothetical protein
MQEKLWAKEIDSIMGVAGWTGLLLRPLNGVGN